MAFPVTPELLELQCQVRSNAQVLLKHGGDRILAILLTEMAPQPIVTFDSLEEAPKALKQFSANGAIILGRAGEHGEYVRVCTMAASGNIIANFFTDYPLAQQPRWTEESPSFGTEETNPQDVLPN